jgi:hypothetical protein
VQFDARLREREPGTWLHVPRCNRTSGGISVTPTTSRIGNCYFTACGAAGRVWSVVGQATGPMLALKSAASCNVDRCPKRRGYEVASLTMVRRVPMLGLVLEFQHRCLPAGKCARHDSFLTFARCHCPLPPIERSFHYGSLAEDGARPSIGAMAASPYLDLVAE